MRLLDRGSYYGRARAASIDLYDGRPREPASFRVRDAWQADAAPDDSHPPVRSIDPIAVMVCNGLASQPVVAAWTVFLSDERARPFLGSLCSLVTNRESDPHSASRSRPNPESRSHRRVNAQAALEPAALPAFFSTYHAVVSLSVIGTASTRSSTSRSSGRRMSSSSHQCLPASSALQADRRQLLQPPGRGRRSRADRAPYAACAARVYPGLLVAAVLCAAGAVLLAGPMNRICISTLERGLLRRALELDLDERRGHLDADRRTPPTQRRGGAPLDERAGAHFLAAASPGRRGADVIVGAYAKHGRR